MPRLCPPVLLLLLLPGLGARSHEWYTALVHTAYTEPGSNLTVRGGAESGRYGDSSPKEGAQGLLGVPWPALPPGAAPEALEGCDSFTHYSVPGAAPGTGGPPPRVPGPDLPLEPGTDQPEPWIALVARGGCTFKEKILNAARHGATAVVIINEQQAGNNTVPMSHLGTGNIVVIMVSYPKGMEIFEPVRSGIPVKMMITVGTRHVQEYISGQSVVFVAIAFITMMIISLAWLIFYYIQRFLYTGAQFGNLNNRKETKKAISQLQLHTVKRGEKGIDVDAENCAVCIENYKPKDVVRILPCKHVFHRLCIDPWLLEHRTCPMCKLDVIKALGFWVDTEDTLDIAVPESMAGSVSAGSLSIAQEDNRSEINNLPSSSTEESGEQCHSPKEDAGETTALLDGDGSDIRHEEHASSVGSFSTQ